MFRSKYPTYTAGAVASSAPVNLQLDFYRSIWELSEKKQNSSEYAEVVQDVLSKTIPSANVGRYSVKPDKHIRTLQKDVSCVETVRAAYDQMQTLSRTVEGRAELNTRLK